MRFALIAALALVLAGCGGHKTTATGPSFVPEPIPVFPGASAPKVTLTPSFRSTDFTLPAGARTRGIYDWYTRVLATRGWTITQRNETGLHAEKGQRTLDVGVRAHTLEINQG